MTPSRLERLAGLALSTWAVAVLALLWIGLAVALATEPSRLDDAWAWLRSLPPVPQVIAWILFLPVAVGLWAWTSDLGQVATLAIGAGLVLWTVAAAASLSRALATT